MLDLDAATTGLCAVGRCGACDRARAAIAALRAVLETTVEEVATAPWPEDFLVGVDPSLPPAKLLVLWTLTYLKRKAGEAG